MRKHSNAVQHMVEDGHSVGLHGITHDVAKIYKSVVGEMLTVQSTLESITGIHSELIRVPYESVAYMKLDYLDAVKNEGFRLRDWNVDSEEYVQRVMSRLASFPYENQSTGTHLEPLLQKLSNQGYSMKAITEQMEPITF
ncbi:polysaccharide deacetylase family protein [Bacillus sp. CH30_1T]|uniref:polysaccharide deacetylase family protein n=1 Tax=Bacillus sp. CH30_1T TaxID=2604836 RepID=UPI0011EEB2EF|nr:polysaccharide deacetylase family protein [Bacillus sp. CH30_1T]KAA0566543.1 polysaccharide deacetylase family protein [Bacillus sp. CH30_1T]